MVERFHRQLKAALQTDEDAPSWSDRLPLVLLGIRCALKEDIGCTAADLVFGCSPRLPGEFLLAPSTDVFIGLSSLKAKYPAFHSFFT